jgi:16S rRNA (guanine527-N7)-methyltransferase
MGRGIRGASSSDRRYPVDPRQGCHRVTPSETTELQANAGRLGVVLDDRTVTRLGRFVGLLEVWNRRFRMTGDRDRQVLLHKHVVDSLAVVAELPPDGPLLDLGTGAGFPGIVLACVRPDRPMVLLEPRRRPTSFLLEVIQTIPLPNVRVVEARAEDAARDQALAGKMAVVVSRALRLERLLDLSAPFLRRPDGRLVSMQARSLDEHVARCRAQAAGLELHRLRDYQLPCGEPRRLLVFGLKPG